MNHASQAAGGRLCEQNLLPFCVPGMRKLGGIGAWQFRRRLPVSEVLARRGKALFSDSAWVAANTPCGSGPCAGGASDAGTWINEAAVLRLRWEPDGQMLQLTETGVKAWRGRTPLKKKMPGRLENADIMTVPIIICLQNIANISL